MFSCPRSSSVLRQTRGQTDEIQKLQTTASLSERRFEISKPGTSKAFAVEVSVSQKLMSISPNRPPGSLSWREGDFPFQGFPKPTLSPPARPVRFIFHPKLQTLARNRSPKPFEGRTPQILGPGLRGGGKPEEERGALLRLSACNFVHGSLRRKAENWSLEL